jgi:hypothetical protein
VIIPAEFTHIGWVTTLYGDMPVNLRETRRWWVTPGGARYKKSNGLPTGLRLQQERAVAPVLNLKSLKRRNRAAKRKV